jgi:hypothetical protein
MADFKAANGNWYTRALFCEYCITDPSSILYTLKEIDHNGYPSLYRLYMDLADPSEHIFANTYLGGWSHWLDLCKCEWFKPYIDSWRKELSVKIKGAALARILVMGQSADTKIAFAANKYILDQEWSPSVKKSTKGRPTKDDITSEAKKIAEAQAQVQSDFERIMN